MLLLLLLRHIRRLGYLLLALLVQNLSLFLLRQRFPLLLIRPKIQQQLVTFNILFYLLGLPLRRPRCPDFHCRRRLSIDLIVADPISVLHVFITCNHVDLCEERGAWHVVAEVKAKAEDGSGQGGSHADCGDEKCALHHDC